MSKPNPDIETIIKVFRSYCEEKNYQIQQSEEANNIRLKISNLSERAIVIIYTTGTVVVQGKQNPLKEEIAALKENFETNPQSFIGAEMAEIKACSTRYDVMLPELRTKIKGIRSKSEGNSKKLKYAKSFMIVLVLSYCKQ